MNKKVTKVKILSNSRPILKALNVEIEGNLYSLFIVEGVGHCMEDWGYKPGTKAILKEGPHKVLGEGVVI